MRTKYFIYSEKVRVNGKDFMNRTSSVLFSSLIAEAISGCIETL